MYGVLHVLFTRPGVAPPQGVNAYLFRGTLRQVCECTIRVENVGFAMGRMTSGGGLNHPKGTYVHIRWELFGLRIGSCEG